MKKAMFKQIIMAVALGAMATGSAFAAVTARVGHAMPESHPQAAAMNKFVELAGPAADGAVTRCAITRRQSRPSNKASY